MDSTVRDMQFSWFTAGKNWPLTGGFGPWMTTTTEISNPQSLSIKTLLNKRVVQQDTTANMIHSVDDIIAYVSHFTPLSPGMLLSPALRVGWVNSRATSLYVPWRPDYG